MNDTLKYPDAIWNPATDIKQSKEYLIVFSSDYSENFDKHEAYIGTTDNPANITHGYKLNSNSDSLNMIAASPWFDALYVIGFETEQYLYDFSPSGKLIIDANHILSPNDKYTFSIKKESNHQEKQEQFKSVNVFPNPLFAYNPATSYYGQNPDDPFVTFSNLPEKVEIKIFTLSGILVKTLSKEAPTSMIRWNLLNESERRVGSGMYLAIVESPGIGQKVLKFAIIMPQKQVHY